MRFLVEEEVFRHLHHVCFGIVVARGIDNKTPSEIIERKLAERIESARERFGGINIKEQPQILPYRNAFSQLGFNANKFMSSIEALVTRIAKGGRPPCINNIVDLGNAVSLKYLVPIGAHDIDKVGDKGIQVRFSRSGDTFMPLGMGQAEELEAGELIYTSDYTVKTRRWIWRQSDEGKIEETSTNIFFPIDGFKDKNLDSVMAARDELAEILAGVFGCQVSTGLVDEKNNCFEI